MYKYSGGQLYAVETPKATSKVVCLCFPPGSDLNDLTQARNVSIYDSSQEAAEDLVDTIEEDNASTHGWSVVITDVEIVGELYDC